MAQDIRELFKNDQKEVKGKMPKGHEARFLEKLRVVIPEQEKVKPMFTWLYIAASLVVLLGLSFGAFKYLEAPLQQVENTPQVVTTKTLGDISPDLKKVEDYYLANINLELSKVKLTPQNKELFDGYVKRLEELNNEYKNLSLELTNNGPSESTVNALINNLKLRLNLLYRLKEQLKDLNTTNSQENII